MEEHCRPHIQVSTPTGHHFAICGYFQDRNSTCNSLKPGPTVYIQQIGVSGFTSQNETLETPSQISKQVGIPLSLLFQPTFGKRKPCWDLLEPIQNSFVPGRHYFSQPVASVILRLYKTESNRRTWEINSGNVSFGKISY